MVPHTCNPKTWDAETEGGRIGGQPGLHSETLSQNNQKKGKKKKKKELLKFQNRSLPYSL
jgi:hypothetical protein